ncbi:MAG: DUF3574 domain-containing protein [Synergistaceae bacterium]|nr:DUF3574 domain-containing protein [Synergistaceae bacterium]
MSTNIKKQRMIIAYTFILLAVLALFAYAEYEYHSDFDDAQYVIYLGTNDKDTNEPVFPFEEAKSKAEEILAKHFTGWTLLEANRAWTDQGQIKHERTILIRLSNTAPRKVHAASDELIKVFNQSSVLIHTNPTRKEFYSGGK